MKKTSVRRKWEDFLKSLGISDFSEQEVEKIDETIGIYKSSKLLGTGSIAGNVLKYIGVCNEDTVPGSSFNTIVSELINKLAQKGIFHVFVFTKRKYEKSFQYIGFNELAYSKKGAILESGAANIETYLSHVPRVTNQVHKTVAAIVMNANPFTKGHRYLVERAARENDLVYVFVVNNDVSLFSTSERFKLVTRGVADLKNVIVVDGGSYMVSYLTFPSYFLPDKEDKIKYQTTIDARIFRNKIASELNIKKRYIGTEPFSKTTGIYNKVLKDELPPRVTVVEAARQKDDTGSVITATKVRKMIAANNVKAICNFVPQTTYKFIEDNFAELHARIERGININGN
ncbi:[citrate (pro-3S)-lyase] ligase [Liquorilactobacillus oeni]|uniref:[citrate (pro-3S)-lyase] ligase n=1 Tax=Liquorilactobacillus oeni TaxID=303241 RepID=UPI001F3B0D00|nr:[citrate (pro-3S)-lyase] ligase [Liquorilactobacillus oeni]